MTDPFHFAAALSTAETLDEALPPLLAELEAQLDGRQVDALFAFLSPHFAREAPLLAARLRDALAPRVLVGGTAESIIGPQREIEQRAALTLVAAHLPGVTLHPVRFAADGWHLLDEPAALHAMVGPPAESKLLILLADPFTSPMERLLTAFAAHYPSLPIVGGMASGARRPGVNALLLDDQVQRAGAVGLALSGAIEADVIVSQGCRPIGPPFTLTKVQRNLILMLDGQPVLRHVQAMMQALAPAEQALLQNGLFIGRAIQAHEEAPGRGDFLIRAVLGVDQSSGALAVGDHLAEGETIQFHVRDAATAEEDLELMLLPQMLDRTPSGGLLFSCNGRGTRLFDGPDRDVSIIQQALGGLALGGCFCAGEFGPIGGRNFVHGHTASLVLFRPARP